MDLAALQSDAMIVYPFPVIPNWHSMMMMSRSVGVGEVGMCTMLALLYSTRSFAPRSHLRLATRNSCGLCGTRRGRRVPSADGGG